MRQILILISLLSFTAQVEAQNQDIEIKSFILEECVIDQPFQPRLIEKTNRFGSNGYKWYVTKYQHTFQTVQKILIIAVANDQQVFEKLVETKKFMKTDFSFIAEYWEKEEHNNFESQTIRLEAELNRYLLGREAMQCAKNLSK